ncbi:MAG: TIR domain-containing protein, partial [Gammaproteobacteria bacterium]|nr:TIR domain-containing protein [Gammaproteobacteria bacterium]
IAKYLREKAGLNPYLDKWYLIPGTPVQEALEKALDESKTCCVFIGPHGIGNYQNEEMRIALEKKIVNRGIRVIPVLLPEGKRETNECELPSFLRRLSWVEFDTGVRDTGALHRLVCGILGTSPGPGEKEITQPPGKCPYRGLEVFREEDRQYFFGRETLVQRLLARLKSKRFLAFIGPSGSGKSSVVQAGLIPALRPDSLIALFTPGERPLEEMAFALRKKIHPDKYQPPVSQYIEQLQTSPESLHYLAREIIESMPAAGTNPYRRFVIIVDQFEEVFTQTVLEHERKQFLTLLLKAVEITGGPVTVILTMRSDFIGRCAAYRDLNIYFSGHLEQVEAMTPEELQSAIEMPARCVDMEFEKGLVDIILNDVKGASSELPLVEHALLELFQYQPRQGNLLTAQAYEAIGRVEGALVRRADNLYDSLTDTQKETVRKMFILGLIQPGEGTEDTRRRVPKEELLAIGSDTREAEKILDLWTTARLLTGSRDEDRQQAMVEVAHEALIRKWQRIREWMDEGREIARHKGILRQAAQEWERNKRSEDYLYQGARLMQMEEFLEAHHHDTSAVEKAFIAAGTAKREAQRKKKQRNMRIFIGSILTVLMIALYFAYRAYLNEKNVLRQLAVNYWDAAHRARSDKDKLKELHLFGEALSVNPDKRFRDVLLTDMNGLWNTAPLLVILPHEGPSYGPIYNKGGTSILTWSADGTARLRDADTGTPIGKVMKHEKAVIGATFNRGETRILTWSDDKTARIWGTKTGTPIGQVMKHEKAVIGATFNHGQTRILTWSYDGTARIWDADTEKPIGQVMKHDGPVDGATFNRDDTRILTWSYDGTARLWDADTGTPIGEVMKH